MSAIAALRAEINDVAEEGDLAIDISDIDLDIDAITDAIELPDGKRIFPPLMFGEPVDAIAVSLLDMKDPSRSRFLRLIGPPGTGKSQIARAIAHRLWTQRGKKVETRHGKPFYGLVEMSPGPSSDEFFFRYDYVPVADSGGEVKLVDSVFVEAMRNGWMVVVDEVNSARDVALLSINSVLDGRLAIHLPATGETVVAQPGFCVVLTYNPGLVGASDIPDAWASRFPATLEVRSNWAALASLGCPAQLVKAAKYYDNQRLAGEDGIYWTPQFRDIEALWDMTTRVGDRHGIALFVSNLSEQLAAGKIQEADAATACRMLDLAGYGEYKVGESSKIPNLHGYPRAIAG